LPERRSKLPFTPRLECAGVVASVLKDPAASAKALLHVSNGLNFQGGDAATPIG
jgi:hypothetical protein